MSRTRMLGGIMAFLATLGLCVPPSAFAAAASPQITPVDTELMGGGVLVGQVVNAQGVGVENATVSLRSESKSLLAPPTGKQGYFAIRNLQPGVYLLTAANGQGICRLWAPGTAPPNAQKGALIVTGDGVARGQLGAGGLKTFFANPWVIAAIVATAVAVPVAIHNSDSHDRPHSP
jgi:hypothetical protein